jgi:G3E family GTPase
MAARARVPILLLTGFLGSGKTTVLARWLKTPEFSGAMTIVNELGEVGLDDRLVQTSNDAPILLENGCACCAASEDLAATLERLFWDRLHRKIPRFEWVLIETTGIAEPQAIRAALARNDIVSERYEIAGTLTVFDARRGADLAALHPECEAQVRDADAIALSMTDLADPAEEAAARAALARLAPHAPVFACVRGALSPATALGALRGERVACGLNHQHTDACGHDHAHRSHNHLADVSTSFLPLGGRVSPEALEAATDAAFRAFGPQLLRIKGAARFADGDAVEIVQANPGAPLERTPYVPPEGAEPPRTGLTIIARGAPASDVALAITSLLRAFPAPADANSVRVCP